MKVDLGALLREVDELLDIFYKLDSRILVQFSQIDGVRQIWMLDQKIGVRTNARKIRRELKALIDVMNDLDRDPDTKRVLNDAYAAAYPMRRPSEAGADSRESIEEFAARLGLRYGREAGEDKPPQPNPKERLTSMVLNQSEGTHILRMNALGLPVSFDELRTRVQRAAELAQEAYRPRHKGKPVDSVRVAFATSLVGVYDKHVPKKATARRHGPFDEFLGYVLEDAADEKMRNDKSRTNWKLARSAISARQRLMSEGLWCAAFPEGMPETWRFVVTKPEPRLDLGGSPESLTQASDEARAWCLAKMKIFHRKRKKVKAPRERRRARQRLS